MSYGGSVGQYDNDDTFRASVKSAWLKAAILMYFDITPTYRPVYEPPDSIEPSEIKLREQPFARAEFRKQYQDTNKIGTGVRNAVFDLLEDGKVNWGAKNLYARINGAYDSLVEGVSEPLEILKNGSPELYQNYEGFCTWLDKQPTFSNENKIATFEYKESLQKGFAKTDTISVGTAMQLAREIISNTSELRKLQDALMKTGARQNSK